MPTFSRAVLARAYAIPVNGSTSGPYTISESHSESTPSSSRRLTPTAKPSGLAAAPSPIPIRIFISLSDHGADAKNSAGLPAHDAGLVRPVQLAAELENSVQARRDSGHRDVR